jgi:hypothetical protein
MCVNARAGARGAGSTRCESLALTSSRTHNRRVDDEIVCREELQAAIDARRELGAELEPQLIESFVERIEQRLAGERVSTEASLKRRREHQEEMVLGTMAISVPLLLIAAIFTGLAGIIAVSAAVAVIAVVSSLQR